MKRRIQGRKLVKVKLNHRKKLNFGKLSIILCSRKFTSVYPTIATFQTEICAVILVTVAVHRGLI